MAKRKTAKIKDLRPESISENELKQLRQIIGAINDGRGKIGTIETQKHALLHQQVVLQEELAKFQDAITKEYGTLDIDINTGKIKYNDEANKED